MYDFLKAYIIAFITGLMYYLLSIPMVDAYFTNCVPSLYYRLYIKSLILITIVYIVYLLLI